ncbi:cell envelope biogenesis protein OmpA [Frateuria sp. Soil773]|uniref:OmpA family protein n=1 Tax=Frateuria sp. Soil773 TaxID=1736407 RepID=UPI0006F977BC|nr:OmpA family protein [Frateuria sp. Soil773]KRE92422.1 cell envelope biogenesis protein OmpA [Frateuria sp. Soil773]
MRIRSAALLALLLAGTAAGVPAAADGTAAGNDKVVVSGTLPSEAVKAQILAKLREMYGADKVVDRAEVSNVVAPGNWEQYVTAMLDANLKQVSHGQLKVEGNEIRISGEVPNEYQRQQVPSQLAAHFNGTYHIHPDLRIGTSDQQVLDQALANRVVEFESGSAILTPRGRLVLDEMAAAIVKLQDPKIAIVGNTDSSGNRAANIQLSLARAAAVRDYLAGKRIPVASMTVSGNGPDQPIADNATEQGRARNRRIDFKILR